MDMISFTASDITTYSALLLNKVTLLFAIERQQTGTFCT
jgi:hypothetical protein